MREAILEALNERRRFCSVIFLGNSTYRRDGATWVKTR